MSDTQIRRIPDRLDTWLRSAIFSWQSLLLLVAIAIFVANSFATPYFLNPWSISDSTFNFTEKALIALAMALVIISGEIDLSVAAIIAFCSTMMGFALQFGVGTPGLVAIGITTGLLCGAFNGVLVSGLRLPSIVVTIGTMSFFGASPSLSSAIRLSKDILRVLPISARAMFGGWCHSKSSCS